MAQNLYQKSNNNYYYEAIAKSIAGNDRQYQQDHRPRRYSTDRYRSGRSATVSPAGHYRRKFKTGVNFDRSSLYDGENSSDSDDESEIDQISPRSLVYSPRSAANSLHNFQAANSGGRRSAKITAGASKGQYPACFDRSISPFCPDLVKKKPKLPDFAADADSKNGGRNGTTAGRRARLRKTYSEPTDLFNVEECDRRKVEQIQDILNSLNFSKLKNLTEKSGSISRSNSRSFVPKYPNSLVQAPGSPNGKVCFSPTRSLINVASFYDRSSPVPPASPPSQSPEEVWSTPRSSIASSSFNGQQLVRKTSKRRRSTNTPLKSDQIEQNNSDDQQLMLSCGDDSLDDFLIESSSGGIKELREAAQTIDAWARRAIAAGRRRTSETPANAKQTAPTAHKNSFDPYQQLDEEKFTAGLNLEPSTSFCASSQNDAVSIPRRSGGITTRLCGQPRGVMQFWPSIKNSELLSTLRSPLQYATYSAVKSSRNLPPPLNKSFSDCEGKFANVLKIHHQNNSDLLKNVRENAAANAEESTENLPPTTTSKMFLPRGSLPAEFVRFGASDAVDGTIINQQKSRKQSLNIPAFSLTTPTILLSENQNDSSNNSINDLHILSPTKSQRFSSFRESNNLNENSTDLKAEYQRITRKYSHYDKPNNHNDSFDQSSPFRGVDSLGSFSRFGKLLKSLRSSRQNSPELPVCPATTSTAPIHMSPVSSESPLSSPLASLKIPVINDEKSYNNLLSPKMSICSANSSHLSSGSFNQFSSELASLVQKNRRKSQQYANLALMAMSQSWNDHNNDNLNLDRNTSSKCEDYCNVSDSDSSMFQADIMLWQRRSRGSLRRHTDTRTHIVRELFDTESSYVENLQLIVHKYLRPLKRPELCTLVESSLVDEIFFQIPEVLGHHELFFAALKSRLDNWDQRQKIGDIILNNFTKQSVIDTYSAFINNWKTAKQAIWTACRSKTAFAKYLERCSREHKNKLTLDALLIMPVQRIPRYELLIKELLKHTSVEHPDYPLLVRAKKEIHDLASKINRIEQESGFSEQMQQRLREIEAIIDGLDDLVSPERIFHRYDLLVITTQSGKKERCMFLFSDQVIITNVKKKSSSALRKIPMVGAVNVNFLESHKFKLLMKISLDDLEVGKSNQTLLTGLQDDIAKLQEDLPVLGKMTELFSLLTAKRENLEKEIDESKDYVRNLLLDKHHEMVSNPTLTSLELLITTVTGVESLTVTFQSAEKRVEWEKAFVQSKELLISSLCRQPTPTFVKHIATQKTRAGLQFSCAAPTLGRNELGYPNVWVCNSDECVGQVGVVNLTPEPDLTCCNGIANARILCICAVPDVRNSNIRQLKKKSQAPSSGKNSLPVSCLNPQNSPSRSSVSAIFGANNDQILNDNAITDGAINMELDSDSSDNESSAEGSTGNSSSKSFNTSGSGEGHSDTSATKNNKILNDFTRQSTTSCDDPTPTMWIGTEDGCIHIFNYNDNIRQRKNKISIPLASAVMSIVYSYDRVFASLFSGNIIYYDRSADGGWNLESYKSVDLDMPDICPILSLTYSASKLWCGAKNRALVVDGHSLRLQHAITVSSDSDCSIGAIAASGLGVWISLQNSPILKLFHVHKFGCLLETNVMPFVTKVLAGCDDVIRQHKLSCLRITSLLCCKDLLWIGTSSGVILNLPIPHVTHNTTKFTNAPSFTAVQFGHCGPCRILTSVDLTCHAPPASGVATRSNSSVGGTLTELRPRRMSLNMGNLQQGKVYVISGGDGFEDLQDLTSNDENNDEKAGSEDTTNYLIVWQT